jgi:hypothetical protein
LFVFVFVEVCFVEFFGLPRAIDFGRGEGIGEGEDREERVEREGEEGGERCSGGGERVDVSVDAAGEDIFPSS